MSAMIAPQRGATGSAQMKEKVPSGYKKASINQFTPEQMELFQQMFSQLGPDSFLNRLSRGDESLFEEMEAPAHRQFAQAQGGIASRFSGMGMGARNSSGFQNTMNQAASDFAQDLQGKRLGLQREAINDLMNMSNQLLNQRPQEQMLIKKQQKEPFWKQLLGMISPAGGDIASGNANNTQNFLKILQSMAGMG